MAGLFIFSIVFTFSFLATVHWLPLQGDEPAICTRKDNHA